VDGFRCDVASLLPQKFWVQARKAVDKVKPGVIWLAESVHAAFVGERRTRGLVGLSDSELYAAFDLTYDYDIWPIFQQAVQGKVAVRRYLEMLRFQDCIYPANFIKMRCVENHDQMRIMRLAPTKSQALAWTAFQAFNCGAFLIYGGQEAGAKHTPSLFDVDKVAWGDYKLQPLLTTLAQLKKDTALVEGRFMLLEAALGIQAAWQHPHASLYGVFNVSGEKRSAAVQLPDGNYTDVLSGATVKVRKGKLDLPSTAVILRYGEPLELKPLYCKLLDYHL